MDLSNEYEFLNETRAECLTTLCPKLCSCYMDSNNAEITRYINQQITHISRTSDLTFNRTEILPKTLPRHLPPTDSMLALLLLSLATKSLCTDISSETTIDGFISEIQDTLDDLRYIAWIESKSDLRSITYILTDSVTIRDRQIQLKDYCISAYPDTKSHGAGLLLKIFLG